jgi:hypothetical protein
VLRGIGPLLRFFESEHLPARGALDPDADHDQVRQQVRFMSASTACVGHRFHRTGPGIPTSIPAQGQRRRPGVSRTRLAPTFGLYQGRGELVGPCVFADGMLSGVTMSAYADR